MASDYETKSQYAEATRSIPETKRHTSYFTVNIAEDEIAHLRVSGAIYTLCGKQYTIHVQPPFYFDAKNDCQQCRAEQERLAEVCE